MWFWIIQGAEHLRFWLLFSSCEFILDTGDLENENANLFTLDVKALYPSMEPELALEAVREVLAADKTTKKNIKTAIAQFI